MNNELFTLEALTGLTNKDLAEVFAKNPRAYMAVKGAVAEKHLEILLQKYLKKGLIKSFYGASGDFDKDFYITLPNGKTTTLECKNIQVLSPSKKDDKIKYINFLIDSAFIDKKTIDKICKTLKLSKNYTDDLRNSPSKVTAQFLKELPQEYRESGIPRYKFSESLIKQSDLNKIKENNFISQFDSHPLKIDFQRTRNSTDKEGNTRRQRLYRTNEIDIVGACLFSRTMKWQFIFGNSKNFTIHSEFSERYIQKMVIRQDEWSKNLLDVI